MSEQWRPAKDIDLAGVTLEGIDIVSTLVDLRHVNRHLEDLDMCICEVVPDNRPRPDWSQAPHWAQWWTIDEDGKSFWWSKRPKQQEGNSRSVMRWLVGAPGNRRAPSGRYDVSGGLDWSAVIQARPETGGDDHDTR